MDKGSVSHNANVEQSLSLLLGDSWPFLVPADCLVPKYTRMLAVRREGVRYEQL